MFRHNNLINNLIKKDFKIDSPFKNCLQYKH